MLATKEVTLAGGASEKVVFTTARDVARTYAVTVGGLSDTLVVKSIINWWLIGGIIGGVLGAGLVLYFLVGKRREAQR